MWLEILIEFRIPKCMWLEIAIILPGIAKKKHLCNETLNVAWHKHNKVLLQNMAKEGKQRRLNWDLQDYHRESQAQPKHFFFFKRTEDPTTGEHHLKLQKMRSTHNARSKFFSNRVVTKWNSLPEEVVSATTTNQFKSRLDRYWADKAQSFQMSIKYLNIHVNTE